MLTVTVRRELLRDVETRGATGDEIQHATGCDRSQYLRGDVRPELRGGKSSSCPQSDRNSGIEMAARNVSDRVGHGEDRETERERDAVESDAEPRKSGSEHRTSTAAQHQPERSEELRTVLFHQPILLSKGHMRISLGEPYSPPGIGGANGRGSFANLRCEWRSARAAVQPRRTKCIIPAFRLVDFGYGISDFHPLRAARRRRGGPAPGEPL